MARHKQCLFFITNIPLNTETEQDTRNSIHETNYRLSHKKLLLLKFFFLPKIKQFHTLLWKYLGNSRKDTPT